MKFTPQYSVSFGCFSSVLSKLLCFGTYSNHSSIQTGRAIEKRSIVEIDKITNVNIVAKLMGLDSILDTECKPSQPPSNSVQKGESMDAMISFQETIGYFDIEDDEFLVLEFEKKRRGKCDGKQRRKNRGGCNEDGRGSLVISERSGGKMRKKKKKIKGCLVESKESEIDCECECENLSPVSILDDHGEFDNEDGEITISEEDAKMRQSNSKGTTKSSQEELLSDDESEETSIQQVQQRERGNNGNNKGKEIQGLKWKDYNKHENIQLVTRICRLAEADIFNNISNNNIFNYFNNYNNNYNSLKLGDRRMSSIQELEDIGRDLGQLIFDELVSELVIHILDN